MKYRHCSKTYTAQISCNLKPRMISHKTDTRLSKNICALSEHVINTGHNKDLNNIFVLCTERNDFKKMFSRNAIY